MSIFPEMMDEQELEVLREKLLLEIEHLEDQIKRARESNKFGYLILAEVNAHDVLVLKKRLAHINVLLKKPALTPPPAVKPPTAAEQREKMLAEMASLKREKEEKKKKYPENAAEIDRLYGKLIDELNKKL